MHRMNMKSAYHKRVRSSTAKAAAWGWHHRYLLSKTVRVEYMLILLCMQTRESILYSKVQKIMILYPSIARMRSTRRHFKVLSNTGAAGLPNVSIMDNGARQYNVRHWS